MDLSISSAKNQPIDNEFYINRQIYEFVAQVNRYMSAIFVIFVYSPIILVSDRKCLFFCGKFPLTLVY